MSSSSSTINRKILITGTKGFIGANVKKYFDNNTICCPVRPDIDLSVFTDLEKIDFTPEIIIHCAANPTTRYSELTIEQINNNVFSTVNILEKFNNIHLINISSILVYGNYETQTLGPNTVYGSTKLYTEHLCNNYSKIKNIKVTNLRIPATVGPSLTHGVLFDIIKKTKENDVVNLFGKEPGSCKPFVHVSELCQVIDETIEKKKYGTFTVSPEDNISVLDIANLVQDKTGITKEIRWSGESWVGDDNHILIKPQMVTQPSRIAIEKSIIENL